MEQWIFPAISLAAVMVAARFLERLFVRRTRGWPDLSGAERTLVGIGTAASVLIAGALLDLALPWLAFVAGASSACMGLVARLFFRETSR